MLARQMIAGIGSLISCYMPDRILALGICILLLPSEASTCEELEPQHTREQCLSSVSRLHQLDEYRPYLSDPLQYKREIIQSFEEIRAILEPEDAVISDCWVHYKQLELTEILSSMSVALSGYEITYPSSDTLLEHDTMFKIYAREQLKVIDQVGAYNKKGLGTALQPPQP